MRDTIWLYLRNSAVGRRVRAYPRIARPLHALGCRLLPAKCRIRSGPCAGLCLKPSPSWPTALWEGGYEPDVQATVDAQLRPGAVFYDVGGGIGLYSLLAARKGARVLVFEPHPDNARCIPRPARLNSFENSIQVIPMAAHSVSGEITMEFAQHGSQMAPRGSGDKRRRKTLQVPCVTLDEFSQTQPPPTLVKVDVEGAESEVLKGAVHLFERVRPRLICEVHDDGNKHYVMGWLAARRYSAIWLGPPGQENHLFGEPAGASVG